MQQDDDSPDLVLAAAKYALGIIHSWDFPPVADAALNRGLYSDSLVELASLCDPIMSDAGPLFEASMAELNIKLPPESTAVQTVLRHYIQRIADGTVAPYDGLHSIMEDVFFKTKLCHNSKEFRGDPHGIQYLIGAYYGYDDLRERAHEVSFEGEFGDAAIAALDAHVIELANEWLRHMARPIKNVTLPLTQGDNMAISRGLWAMDRICRLRFDVVQLMPWQAACQSRMLQRHLALVGLRCIAGCSAWMKKGI